MAKFVYRMQNILDIKSKMEVQARNSFAIARNKLTEEENKLDGLFIKKNNFENSYRNSLSGPIDLKEINQCKLAIEYTKNQIKKQLIEVKVAGKNLEMAQLRLNEVMKERKIHEKLKEKSFDEFLKDLSDQEKKEIDELVSFRFENNN